MPRKILDQVLAETRIDIENEAALEFQIRNLSPEPAGK
jgi:hypothetical protein